MINLETVHFLQKSITFLIAYVPSASFVGWFEAWIANKLGDSTAKDEGYLTLNPYMHMDMFFIIPLILSLPLILTKKLPINLHHIHEPRKNLKVLLLFNSKSLAHIMILVASFIMQIIVKFFFTEHHLEMLQLILSSFILLNLISAAIYLINAAVEFLVYYFVPNLSEESGLIQTFIFALPIIIMVTFGNYITYFVYSSVYVITISILNLLHKLFI